MRLVVVIVALLLAEAGIPVLYAQMGHTTQERSKWSTPAPSKRATEKAPKPCSQYGEGFYYLPGTNSCAKVNGYVRGDVYIGSGGR